LGVTTQICVPFATGDAIAVFEPRSPPITPSLENVMEAIRSIGVTVLMIVPAFLQVKAHIHYHRMFLMAR
jgi:hypothetical protein